MFQDLVSWRSLIAVEVKFRATIAVHSCALRMLSERPAQKACRYSGKAMPADRNTSAHSAITETSAHPVSKSGSKKDYTIPRPHKRGLVMGWAAAYSAETGSHDVRWGPGCVKTRRRSAAVEQTIRHGSFR